MAGAVVMIIAIIVKLNVFIVSLLVDINLTVSVS